MLKTSDLFDLTRSIAAPILEMTVYPWEALDNIKEFILAHGKTLSPAEFDSPCEGVWIARDASVAPTAFVGAPCIIDHKAEIRHGAFIRGSVIIGKSAVVGNSSEIKNAVLFDGAQVPHFNYVGDSILGHKAHMGAGAVTSNVKGDKTPVTVRCGDEQIKTGRKKMGAMLGDNAEIGCNSVLNPGTIIGRSARVYPLSSVRGTVPERAIYKRAGDVIPQE